MTPTGPLGAPPLPAVREATSGRGTLGWMLLAAWLPFSPHLYQEPPTRLTTHACKDTLLLGANAADDAVERQSLVAGSPWWNTCSCLSAAADALKAFVLSHVVPTLAAAAATSSSLLAQRKESLLSPVLAYLQG